MLNRKELIAVALIVMLVFVGFSIMGSGELGTDQADVFYERITLAPGDKDTTAFWWKPHNKGRPGFGKTEGFNTLVIIADSSVTDFGDQDSLKVVSKDRYYLYQVKGVIDERLADLTTGTGIYTYQSASNDSTIHATHQAYTFRQPVVFTLRLNMADGVALFFHNQATLGDSTRFHVYVYNK